jgi:hypothetical protein
MDAVAGWARFLVGLGWLGRPLPAPVVKHGTAGRAASWLVGFVFGFVSVVPIFLYQAVMPDWLKAGKSRFHFVLLGWRL